jgi:hypothetical protein
MRPRLNIAGNVHRREIWERIKQASMKPLRITTHNRTDLTRSPDSNRRFNEAVANTTVDAIRAVANVVARMTLMKPRPNATIDGFC